MRITHVSLCLSILFTSQAAHAGQDHKTWKDYGGGPDSSHFVDLRQIDKSTVNQLEVAWTYPTGDNRTYVFNPLLRGLATRVTSAALAPYLAVVAFFITFLLMGVWHGATSVFVVYGLFMGAGASVNKLWQLQAAKRLGKARYKALCERPLSVYAARGLTFAYFALGLTCLWLNLGELAGLSARLGVHGWLVAYLALAGGAAATFAVWDGLLALVRRIRSAGAFQLSVASHNLLLASQVLLILYISSFFHKSPEFVYRAF